MRAGPRRSASRPPNGLERDEREREDRERDRDDRRCSLRGRSGTWPRSSRTRRSTGTARSPSPGRHARRGCGRAHAAPAWAARRGPAAPRCRATAGEVEREGGRDDDERCMQPEPGRDQGGERRAADEATDLDARHAARAPRRSAARRASPTTRRAAGMNIPDPRPSSRREPTNSQRFDAIPNQSIPSAATASPARSRRRVWPRSAYRARPDLRRRARRGSWCRR